MGNLLAACQFDEDKLKRPTFAEAQRRSGKPCEDMPSLMQVQEESQLTQTQVVALEVSVGEGELCQSAEQSDDEKDNCHKDELKSIEENSSFSLNSHALQDVEDAQELISKAETTQIKVIENAPRKLSHELSDCAVYTENTLPADFDSHCEEPSVISADSIKVCEEEPETNTSTLMLESEAWQDELPSDMGVTNTMLTEKVSTKATSPAISHNTTPSPANKIKSTFPDDDLISVASTASSASSRPRRSTSRRAEEIARSASRKMKSAFNLKKIKQKLTPTGKNSSQKAIKK
mmetsp:Transcript_10142/g.19864  ORF Transcript_10142/g.19864 Transcript_10142/m.19864 type:complete len:291 (-) Transcript_10142:167-1039(-)|eukprot:CAMPEP_0171489954 /NCGR_PEP_ID=MMETSP0958-20121227/3044_1 /TAXON_ID=87120 /ORGANISM="Aurantiochytrium limacinum, Strain ATCCMYA-1381" /LENGTH=290 /DNA_ID=CAMNT_0012023225 /DNA_START=94 /DNA_END=966 /DNA_ORIENTATION=-